MSALDPVGLQADLALQEKKRRRPKGANLAETLCLTQEWVRQIAGRGVKYVYVTYDIPTALEQSGQVPNPSRLFHGLGVRPDWSGWTFREEVLSHPLFIEERERWDRHRNELRPADGVRYRIRKAHPDETAAFREEAREALRSQMREAHEALVTTVFAVTDRYAALKKAAETEAEAGRLDRRRVNEVRNHLNRAAERIQQFVQVVEIFEESDHLDDAVTALRDGYRVEAEAFAQTLPPGAKPAPEV